jgi:hypothetical protein
MQWVVEAPVAPAQKHLDNKRPGSSAGCYITVGGGGFSGACAITFRLQETRTICCATPQWVAEAPVEPAQ